MKCPKCSDEMVKRGFRSTNLGRKQLYMCGSCGRKVTPEWPRMRFTQKDVMHAVSLHEKGMSSSKIQSTLKQNDIQVSRWTIIKWHRKFS